MRYNIHNPSASPEAVIASRGVFITSPEEALTSRGIVLTSGGVVLASRGVVLASPGVAITSPGDFLAFMERFKKQKSKFKDLNNQPFIKTKNTKQMKDYIPAAEGDLVIWLNNFSAKVQSQGLTYGLDANDLSNVGNSSSNTISNVNSVEQTKASLKNMVSQKDTVKDGTINLVRSIAQRIKTHPLYTDAVGQDMGIIASNNAPDLQNMKPTLTAETFPGFVRLKFTKKGFTAVNISARIKGTPGWTFLATDTNSPYEDHRPLAAAGVPEIREYMAICLDGDNEVGQQSDIVSVTFGG